MEGGSEVGEPEQGLGRLVAGQASVRDGQAAGWRAGSLYRCSEPTRGARRLAGTEPLARGAGQRRLVASPRRRDNQAGAVAVARTCTLTRLERVAGATDLSDLRSCARLSCCELRRLAERARARGTLSEPSAMPSKARRTAGATSSTRGWPRTRTTPTGQRRNCSSGDLWSSARPARFSSQRLRLSSTSCIRQRTSGGE